MFKFVHIRDGQDNFFTPIRLLLAVMVMIGHCYYVVEGHLYAKSPLAEPAIFFDYRPGFLAVNLFFIASGFLITKSIMYRGPGAEFIAARVLRIFPALIVHVLFVMFVMGPFVTTLPLKEFFSHSEFLSQPFKVLSFYRTEMILPSALQNNTEQVGSATLWTLRYEVLAYMGTWLVFVLGLMKRDWMFLMQFLCFALLLSFSHLTGIYDQLSGTVKAILRLGVAYSLGAAIYAYRHKLSFHILGILILGCVTAIFHDTVIFEVMTNVWMAYIVFWMAYVKIPKLQSLQTIDDVSYGLYIYHYCVLQWIYHVKPSVSILELLFWATPISFGLAYASWYLVEKPFLAQKEKFGNIIASKFRIKKIKKLQSPAPLFGEHNY